MLDGNRRETGCPHLRPAPENNFKYWLL
uniref:Uncharacterized protein n=1 Tax=Rhizophora mucronata TaxID=61149 RepID=A0A2P2MIF3_RHIMU